MSTRNWAWKGKLQTVSDKGNYFYKSFRQFGPRFGIAATAHRPAADDICGLKEVLGPQPQPQPLDLIEMELMVAMILMTRLKMMPLNMYVHVTEILAQGSEHGGLYKLLEHLRCAVHTMNLVCTTDVKAVLEKDR